MYGFATQTEQETIDSLEVVRQLFEHALIHSAYWHLFTVTAHSPVGKAPEEFKIKLAPKQKGTFANNDLVHTDTANDHEKFGKGLNKAVYNFMHDIGFDFSMQEWFDFPVPETTVDESLIENYLQIPAKQDNEKLQHRLVYIGEFPVMEKNKKKAMLSFYSNYETIKIRDTEAVIRWIYQLILDLKTKPTAIKLIDLSESFESKTDMPFSLFMQSSNWQKLRNAGLLIIS
jgi:hypothetical protein